MKSLVAVASVAVIVALAVIFSSRHTVSPADSPAPFTSTIKAVPQKPTYKPEDVVGIVWSEDSEKIELRKKGNTWVSLKKNKIDSWGVNRRVVILSHLPLGLGIEVVKPKGEVTLKTVKGDLNGLYDEERFVWTTGPDAKKGFRYFGSVDLKDLFEEGLWGFKSHTIDLCSPKNITEIKLEKWSGEKKDGSWNLTHEDGKTSRAQSNVMQSLLESVCTFSVDVFQNVKTDSSFLVFTTLESGNKKIEIRKREAIFFIDGYPPFKAEKLEALLNGVSPFDLIDPTFEEAKVAVDRHQPQEARIKAIRHLRGNTNPEAIKALKEIVFEDTDIDLYRYEAVDTLANTGTKEAYKIIKDRLAQVGRSGFELRLARALASGMGRFFNADEKTPEEVRRPEVDELLKAAEEKPPGK